jgi:predicted DNA-binding protein with PD1-like motif
MENKPGGLKPQPFVSLNRLLAGCALFVVIFTGCKSNLTMQPVKAHAFRLKPGQDLRQELKKIVDQKQITAGWISTCVGSLDGYNIRFANQSNGSTGTGYYEIVSLTGTVSVNGSHVHLSVSDSSGKTIGGHLLDGCKIYTTAEIVLLEDPALEFKREKDGSTPWEELQITPKL